jgi:hypothetical protein
MTLTVPPSAHGELRGSSELAVSAETHGYMAGAILLGRPTNQYERCRRIDAIRANDSEVLA